MSYLIMPLYAHFDSGFGMTGEAFKQAADRLAKVDEGNKLFHQQLPINFLYRHAIELFLKSAIVIFHRKLKLQYGEAPYDAEPMVKLAEGDWRPFNRVHSIAALWAYVKELFSLHAEWLAKNTPVDWTFDPALDDWIEIIEKGDPRSTFFRYPTTKNPEADASKSVMKKVSEEQLTEAFKNSNPPENKVFALVVQDEDTGEFIRAYRLDNEDDTELDQALHKAAETFGNMHAALRFEVTKHQ